VTTREAALHRAQRPSATVLRERDDRRPPRRDPRPIRNQLDEDPVADQDAAPRAAEVADLLRREQEQLRDALAEPDVSFIVTPVAAEAHFVRDHDGAVRPAGEVERERARPRREFGGGCGPTTLATVQSPLSALNSHDAAYRKRRKVIYPPPVPRPSL